MKVKLTEEQYKLLTRFINEDRQAKSLVSLKGLVDKNPNATYFSITQHTKGGSESEYFFKLIKSSDGSGLLIQDMNVGTVTGTQHGKREGCQIDAHLDNMIYGNKFSVSFGQCGTLTINNVIGAKIYTDETTAKAKTPIDSIEVEHNLDKSPEDMLDTYYDMLRHLSVDQEVYFDSKYKWDGIVTRRTSEKVEIELFQHGIPSSMNEDESKVIWDKPPTNKGGISKNEPKSKKKPEKKPLTLMIDLNQNPFYIENGKMMFKADAYDKFKNERKDFIISIKSFDVSNIKTKRKEEDPKDSVENIPDDELVSMSKDAMQMILDNPDLKRAFYKHPNLWQLFKAEVNGKKAPGTGILPTLQFINKYSNSKRIDNFELNRPATYSPYNTPVDFHSGGKNYSIKVGEQKSARVREYSLDAKNNFTLLENKNDKIKISVKRKANKLEDVEDVYVCLISKGFTKSDGSIEWVDGNNGRNIYIKFIDSDGYVAEHRETKIKPNTTN